MQALYFVVHALLTLVVVAFLLRVLMPLARADFRNPVGEAVLKVTNPLVLPLRRAFKPAGRIDLASVVALLLVQFAATALLGGLFVPGPASALALLGQALRDLLRTALQFYSVVILLYALLSWVAPPGHNPAAQLLARLAEPLLGPIRSVLPAPGGLDLSPLVALIGLQALQILVR